ncbi:hypothetical protein [Streptomyces sp. NPDC059071]|uniref:hypothetical protein n=1 Tax=unclassified Streptomyces TaxID=2593676 RepID=UPI003647B649
MVQEKDEVLGNTLPPLIEFAVAVQAQVGVPGCLGENRYEQPEEVRLQQVVRVLDQNREGR